MISTIRYIPKSLRTSGIAVRSFSTSFVSCQELPSSKTGNSSDKPAKGANESSTGQDWGREAHKSKRSSGNMGPINHLKDSTSNLQEMNELKQAVVIDPSFYPRFDLGMTYDPFDFSMTKIKMDRQARFSQVNIPLDKSFVNLDDIWKNPQLLSDYVNSNGKILKGVVTGNSPKTQKKIAKAIRRARAAGLMPYFHKPHLNFRN